MAGNTQYKDSVFTLLFQEKEKLIELYNAIKGTHYDQNTELEINTLEDVLYKQRKNDISFTIDGKFIVLVEHQSTINENMPLRFLLYIARVYEKIIDNAAIYKEKQIPIPTPEFIVLYNGSKNYPEEKILKLSDAFLEKSVDIKLELSVRVININYSKSREVLEKSKTLEGYSYFVYLVRKFQKKGEKLGIAIQKAIEICSKENILRDFLVANGSEVVNMLLTEFNLEDATKVWKEEAREETIKIIKLHYEGVENAEIAKKLSIEKAEVNAIIDELEN